MLEVRVTQPSVIGLSKRITSRSLFECSVMGNSCPGGPNWA